MRHVVEGESSFALSCEIQFVIRMGPFSAAARSVKIVGHLLQGSGPR